MDQFDAYFRRADLDHDGRISGAEAVAFLQGSNLPKPVLAQIWQYADQNRTSFLGRQEFYNALKLVTVAQSKRELTPDLVKAALYGPASAKIPAPQINLAAFPAAQPNSMAPRPPTQQPGVVTSTVPQNFGIRGQVPPNSMAPPSVAPPSSAQYFAPQGNQLMRPPLTGSRPPQGVGGSNFPAGGGLPGPGLSNVSGDWLGGRGVVVPPPTSQVPNLPVGSTAPKPQDPLSASSFTAPRPSVGGGNGVVSDTIFGGDVFSASPLSKPSSSPLPTYTASSPPATSAVVPVTSEPQAPAKTDPLGALSAFTRQPTGGQVLSAGPLYPSPNQQGPSPNTSLGSSGFPVEAKNQVPNPSQPQWPKMTRAGVNKYMKVFVEVDTDRDGKISGEQARSLFLSWRLPREILKQVWDLSDQDNDSMLSLREFCIALYLMERYREGHNLPPTLPSNVLLDETLMSLTGPPNPSFGSAGYGATPGFRPPQGIPQPLQMPHAGLRPPMQGAYARPDIGPMQYNQQKGPVPSMDNSHANQLRNGNQNSSDSNSQVTTETEKAVEDKKVILDSREKIEFYRNKMQDLVLYKSRCDNRLNEITERALGDKREAELLAKKYEEKYKQVAEVASKLTIEEASFRDIQERKMELNQAIVKMEQGGSADGLLQVRADRIQSDLEELLKALADRCKKHGIQVKSTAIIELPQGWQPGVPEISAVWDEDWDKFEDEGFSFDVAVAANGKSTTHPENSSTIDDFSSDSYSNANGKSEKPFEAESAYAHSEDESTKSPPGNPSKHNNKVFESPTKEDSNSHFGNSFDADSETQRSFDEQGWGTFDNNDDVDSVWGFNNDTTKGADHEKLGENYFFDSSSFSASPRRTDSPQANTFFQKKSPFGFDDSVPGSPASRAATSPQYSGGGAENSFFDSFSRYDSFSTTDHGSGSPKRDTFSRFDSMSSTTQDQNFSRFDSMSSTTQDRNFARFDSMSSNVGFDHGPGYSLDDLDPFGSSGPFKVSSESQTGKNDSSDKWAF